MLVKKSIINVFLTSNQDVRAYKKEVAVAYFDDRCDACLRSYGTGRGFSFHHMDYRDDRKTYDDFGGTIAYNRYVLPEIVAEPKRFKLLCKSCHNRIDNFRTGMARIPGETLARLYAIAFMTTKKPRGHGNATNDALVTTPHTNALENAA